MKKYIYMAVAAIAALSSCSSDNDLLSGETGKKALTFTATMEGSATRATYNSTEKCAQWEATDQISVNGKTYNAQSAGLTTTFTAAIPGQEAGEAPYHAYFACTYNGTTATLPAAVSETWADGKFNMPMYATSNTTDLQFYNLCGVLKITVKSSQIAAVKKIRVSSATKAVSGVFTVTNNAAVLTNPSTVANALTITYTAAVPTTPEGVVFYVAVPAQDYRRLKISLSADGNGFTKSMITKSDADITVARNKIYPITFAANAAPATTGTAEATINSTPVNVNWVQLWAGGPKFADRNIGASNVTDGGHRKNFTDASADWGANWRTPIRDDMNELFKAASFAGSTKVTCVYENVDGVWGFTFTGKEPGYTTNSVFLPCFAELSSSSAGTTSYWAGPVMPGNSEFSIKAGQMELALDVNKKYWSSRWLDNYCNVARMFIRPVLSSSYDSDLPTGVAFTATMEGDIDNSSCTWKGGDLISINGKTYSAQYGGQITTLNPVTPGQEAEGDDYTAYFPATLYDNGTLTLPAAVSETWANGKFNMPMYATSSNIDLQFKNLCGLLKITVQSDWIDKVKKIRVSSANNAFSGEFTVDANNAAVLTNASNVANTLTVSYADAVPTTAEGVVFYVAVPAQTYQQLTIELSADGSSFTESMTIKNGDIVVERNNICPITFRHFLDTPGLSEDTEFGF